MPALQYFDVPLNGGLNTRDAMSRLGGDFYTLSFWDNLREGSLSSRFSAVRLMTQSGPTTQMWSVLNTAGTTAYLIIHLSTSGVVQASPNPATGPIGSLNTLFTWTTTQLWMSLDVLNGSVYMVNGTDTPQSWSMATDTTVIADVTAMPKAQYIKMYKNYCFVAKTSGNRSRVFFSTIKDPTTWPTNNFQDVAPNDGDSITGLFPTPEGLMIFKSRSVWMMVGDAFDATNPQWRLIRLNTPEGVGGMGQTAAFLAGVGVVWVGRDGVYAWDGATVSLLSEKIRPTLELLNLSVAAYAGALNGNGSYNSRREAQATVFKNRYWFTAEQTAGSSVRAMLWMDTQRRWHFVPDINITAIINYATSTFGNELLVYLGGTGEIVEWEVTRSTSPTTTSFNPADAYTDVLDLGDATKAKQVRRGFCEFSVDNTYGTMTMPLTFIPDGDTTRQVAVTLSAANGTVVTAATASADRQHVQERLYRQQFEINLVVRTLQIRLQSAVTSQTDSRLLASLHFLRLEYITQSIQGGVAP